MSTRMCIVGTIATVPYYSNAPDRVAYCSFRVASNDRIYDQDKREWIDVGTNWYTINAFRALAEHAKKSFAVGDRVIAYGRVRVNNWESKGKNGTSVEVEVEALGHDLRWGVTSFTKLVEAKPTVEVDAAASGAPEASASVAAESQDGLEDDSAWGSPATADGPSSTGVFGRVAA